MYQKDGSRLNQPVNICFEHVVQMCICYFMLHASLTSGIFWISRISGTCHVPSRCHARNFFPPPRRVVAQRGSRIDGDIVQKIQSYRFARRRLQKGFEARLPSEAETILHTHLPERQHGRRVLHHQGVERATVGE